MQCALHQKVIKCFIMHEYKHESQPKYDVYQLTKASFETAVEGKLTVLLSVSALKTMHLIKR